jgi:hypothetical protein
MTIICVAKRIIFLTIFLYFVVASTGSLSHLSVHTPPPGVPGVLNSVYGHGDVDVALWVVPFGRETAI